MTGGILCVFAHPDDEQFGTASALIQSARRGIPVHVLCATRGDAGEISDPALATRETLAAVREQELRTACEIMGIEEPILLDYLDGGLPDVDPDELRDVIIEEMRRLKPSIVITFDANGGYGHPDHIAIHFATLAAWELTGDGVHRPDLGEPHTPAKLYATAYPRSQFEAMGEVMSELGMPAFDLGSVQTIPVEEFGTPDELLTTLIDATADYDLRVQSMFAHRTQFGPESLFAVFPEEINRKLFAKDCFRRIYPAPAPGAVLPDESDIWDGLTSPEEQ